MERYEEAIEDFSRAISLDSGFAEAYAERSRAEEAIGDLESAEEDYARALEYGYRE
ncbi:hypothetical protein JW921_01690 [Candidatus Fermentibacterales bacterium]|nr:hypothetical protein [Candidatus Fermentibacterales bacterium]